MFKYGKFSVLAYTYTCNTLPVSLGMHILHKNLKLSVVGPTRLVALDTTEYTHTQHAEWVSSIDDDMH